MTNITSSPNSVFVVVLDECFNTNGNSISHRTFSQCLWVSLRVEEDGGRVNQADPFGAGILFIMFAMFIFTTDRDLNKRDARPSE